MSPKVYALPALPYGYGDLAPYISEEQLKLHHTKHHHSNYHLDLFQMAHLTINIF